MNKKQAFNPYLPSYEYIPDGEPHVFDDRIYIYGSHDRFDGADFCLNDYICYSADFNDLTEWKYEGVIYRKEQDPRNQNVPSDAPKPRPGFAGKADYEEKDLNAPGIKPMFAPDVVRGVDGRFYLYYCVEPYPEVSVAVCDTPAGRYEYYGKVHYADGTLLGMKEGDYICFDPGAFVDDDKITYLYVGNAPIRAEYEDGKKHSVVMKLEDDMLTIKGEVKKLMPSITESEGTGYQGHEFFEASSIRKIDGKYYFVYSSVNSHELCYAISEKPDADYVYGGTLVDIGDVYLDGREAKDAINHIGNTHGGIECVNGQWYVFYHRQTNRTQYSRQACAEKVYFDEDGKIDQTEVTSCGLNAGALLAEGTYPVRISCALRHATGCNFSHPMAMREVYPYFTQDGWDIEPEDVRAKSDDVDPVQYIKNITDGTVFGFKYFALKGNTGFAVEVRGEAKGKFEVLVVEKGATLTERYADMQGVLVGEIPVNLTSAEWTSVQGTVTMPTGEYALYVRYVGTGSLDAHTITFA